MYETFYEPNEQDLKALAADRIKQSQEESLKSKAPRAHFQILAEIRWSFGVVVPEFKGRVSGCHFVSDAEMVLKAVSALKSRGTQEGCPAPCDNSAERIIFYSWYEQQGYSDHSGWAITNNGMSSQKFAWVAKKLQEVWKPNTGNYSAAGFRGADDQSAIFEFSCYGIGD